MTDTKMCDPACEWCAGTGWRASRPHAWYQTHPDMVTTMFPCTCGTPPAPQPEPTAPVGDDQDTPDVLVVEIEATRCPWCGQWVVDGCLNGCEKWRRPIYA